MDSHWVNIGRRGGFVRERDCGRILNAISVLGKRGRTKIVKRLLILRHAKASQGAAVMEDCDRPLNERGRKQAPLVGAHLLQEEILPDAIISSSAVRARETAEGVARACGYLRAIDFRKELYIAEPGDYVRILSQLPDEVGCPMVVGHNPVLEGLVVLLTGHRASLSTAALASISLPISSWTELAASEVGSLETLWSP